MVDDEVKKKLKSAFDSVKGRVEVERQKKRGKKPKEDVSLEGKVYRDNYKIKRVGDRYTNPKDTILVKYVAGVYDDFELIKGIPDKVKGWVRRGSFEYSWMCCYKGEPANDEIFINIDIEDVYPNETESIKLGGRLNTWFDRKSEEAGNRIAEDECEDWNSKYKVCGQHGYISKRGRITEEFEIIEVPEKKKPTKDIIAERNRMLRIVRESLKKIREATKVIAELEEEYEFED